MGVLEVHDVSIRYITGDFKDIGLKEYVMRKISGNYHVAEFWADHHISFSLEQGDMLGITGTNGAGKSTLLKAISGIMEPTGGYVKREGSIAALLELASGFDGDLTVRENTYLRGAMLGYTRKFMDEKYPEIIEFAELQDFQDRPFKQLSSGMMSRLAFSVASLVHPDILILDEVLSVGDGAFRRKSEAKMREIINSGATTILVSHSVEQVREMCNKVLWIEKGEQIGFGESALLCDLYQNYLDGVISLEEAKKRLEAAGARTIHQKSEYASGTTDSSTSKCGKTNGSSFRSCENDLSNCRECSIGNLPGDKVFLLGVFILSLFFFTLADTTLLFALNISVSRLNLFIAVLCSTIACFLFSGRSVRHTMETFFFGMILLGIAVVLSGLVFEWSYDGNTYHKSITGALKWGWNPLYETFYDFAEDIPFLSAATATWYDAYPKLAEIWAACLYTFTNSIETGKCFNILSFIAGFCICFGVLARTGLFNKLQIFFCALFCVANPVSLSQITTYYVDGFLWHTFLICMAALLYLTFWDNGHYKKICFYLIFICINLGFNIKFSALIYFAVLCICFFGYWVISKCKECGWKAGRKWITRRFLFFAFAVISGAGLFGATSYGINFFRHANPVYTMIGEGSTEILIPNLPVVFRNMPHAFRFVASLLSRTNGSLAIDQVEWKIPFTFHAAEISSAQEYDVRTAGWGVLFSGIFLLSLAIFWIARIRLKEEKKLLVKRMIHLSTLLMEALAFCICFVPGLCWARYNGVLFYIPIGVLLFLFASINYSKSGRVLYSFLAGIMSIALFLNVVPNFERIWLDFKEFRPVKEQLLEFKAFTESCEEPVPVGFSGDGSFEGRFFSLYDYGITNFVFEEIMPEDVSGTLFTYNRGLCYRDPQKDDAIKVIKKLHNTKGKLVLFSVKDEASKSLTPDFISEMQKLGLSFPLKECYQSSYIAAIKDGEILTEEISDEKLSYQTEIENISLEVISAGYNSGNTASIKINNVEYAVNQRGLNIVVYDTEENRVVDSVCIDTYLDNRVIK